MPTDAVPVDCTVLLIEDNPDHVMLFTELLNECPYVSRVQTISDGAAALRFIAEQPAERLPAAVLLDLKLPRVDGAEVLQGIRALPAWRNVPVIILTTSTSRADVALCRGYGATAYLTKVVTPAQLRSQIHQAMDRWVGGQPCGAGRAPVNLERNAWELEYGF